MTNLTTTCQECLSMLDMVVSDALAGSSTELHYPAIHQHLSSCADCREAYDEVLDTLQREAAGHTLRAPHQRPPQPGPNSWSLRLSPSPPAPWKTIHCSLPGAHLRSIIATPPPTPHARLVPTPGQLDWLLMADALRRPPATIAMQVSLQSHWSAPEQIAILTELSSDYPLPHPLEASLTWGDMSQTRPVDDSGRARFTGLPAALGHPPISDLSLTFTHVE